MGPKGSDIVKGKVTPDSLPYALVPLNERSLDILTRHTPGLSRVFQDRRAPGEIKFGVGDVVAVTIFESQAGGLFIPEQGDRPGNFISLPNQAVDSAGNISVPYAGAIAAAGRTAADVQKSIVDALSNRAIEPQVVVALVDQRTSLFSVLGEVNAPARIPASAAAERILDAITRAGGPKGQGFDTWITLERKGRRESVPFGALVYEPSNNIYVHPNDTIYVYREPQTFVAFGAAGQQGQFNFDAWRISMAEGVAKAGGLNDTLADPGMVFVYRGESREVAESLGLDVTRFPGPVIPVVYHVNFRDPSEYFLATKFQMRNKDLLYVSNATAVETAKILNYIRLITATTNDPLVAAQNGVDLHNSLQ